LLTGSGHGHSQVGHRGGLAIAGKRARDEESLHAFVEEHELQRRAKGAVSLRRRRMWACLGDEKRPIGILPFPNIWDQPQYRSGITQRRLKVIPCSDRIV